MKPKKMNPLIEAYKNTKYKIFEPSIIIEIGKLNEDLDKLLLKYNTNEWAFITAYNPYSRVLSNKENTDRHNELKELATNYVTFEGHGVGEDSSWEPELSLLIIGISKNEAINMGKKFEQNAIVYGILNNLPELLITNNKLD
jgi:hypothetical protein